MTLRIICGVTKNCDYFAKMYPVLNRDLLLTAAIFHDIGKLKELSTFPENDYTDAGQLLGHIMIGAEWVGDAIKSIDGFPVVLANELKHCILAHHGVKRRTILIINEGQNTF